MPKVGIHRNCEYKLCWYKYLELEMAFLRALLLIILKLWPRIAWWLLCCWFCCRLFSCPVPGRGVEGFALLRSDEGHAVFHPKVVRMLLLLPYVFEFFILSVMDTFYDWYHIHVAVRLFRSGLASTLATTILMILLCKNYLAS